MSPCDGPMQGDAYITLLGRSTWALINTYYAVLREKGLRPDRIFIVVETPYADASDLAVEGIRIVSKAFGCTPDIHTETVREADFVGAGRTVRSLAGDLIGLGYRVALDITSGRKAMVAGALIATSLAHLDIRHIYYLAMKSLDDVAKPYMMIPLQIQQIRDFIEDAGALVKA